ncbi:hypothetical protein E1N52_39215 [Paraburkholderia guartelaensis]|uniref:Uncharacterized protein n=1 Tax=Paraburkholderia guartelaensis TaxID=2546446 RepID=A0A4V2ZUU9_9BURK|nr:hypothetical protein [Paraburkholderia guartelaensis]TDG02549.1 hypothetical protein E1N52_39215 [Paraburkholderia guartelaensis]
MDLDSDEQPDLSGERMTNLFFTARRSHNVGEILGGGNFGRGYDQYVLDTWTSGGAESGWRMASEMIVETVRLARYPTMPSRLTCSYAYPNEQVARSTMTGSQVPLYLYEVELVDPSKPCYTLSRDLMSVANRMPRGVPFAPHVRVVADQYWSSTGGTYPEVITESPLRVVRHLPWRNTWVPTGAGPH